MKSVEIAAIAMDLDTASPVVVLREQDAPHRLLPITVGAHDAAAIAYPASGAEPPRPLTADLLTNVLSHLDAQVEGVQVTELRHGTFMARLDIDGPAGRHSLDARPSDAIAVALRVGAPVFVSESVLDEAGTIPAVDELDEETIEETVEEFRAFLDELEPARFALDEPDDGDASDHGV